MIPKFEEGRCPRCGAAVAGGVAGCFELAAEVFGREYTNPAYAAVHLLTVDAHALQHPEDHGIKNNAFHLLRLCWLLEYDGDARIGSGPRWLQRAFDGVPDLPSLEPPTDRGRVTVADVAAAGSAAEHVAAVKRWARAVWEAWEAHHAWAREWLAERLTGS